MQTDALSRDASTTSAPLTLCELGTTDVPGLESFSPFCLKAHRALRLAADVGTPCSGGTGGHGRGASASRGPTQEPAISRWLRNDRRGRVAIRGVTFRHGMVLLSW